MSPASPDTSKTGPASAPGPNGHGLVRRLDVKFLKFRRHIKRKLRILDPLRVDVYIGYAGPRRAIVRGRALENELPKAPCPNDTVFDNLRRSLRQLESDEVPDLTLKVALAGQEQEVVTDDEGYFLADFELPEALQPGWPKARAEVVDRTFELSQGVVGEGPVYVPSPEAQFGVISDIDDTILQSHVRNRLRQAYVTLLGNAVTRLSFEGTAALYQGLKKAGQDAPFFYVSRSAWNIHAVLEHFIAHQGLPTGPLVLRDVSLFAHPEHRRGHKRREIDRIYQMYPELPFVLVGDSGQKDPYIYMDIAARNPGRVRAILIRNVSSPRDKRRLVDIFQVQCPASCPWLVFEDDGEAAHFCLQHGLWQDAGAPQA